MTAAARDGAATTAALALWWSIDAADRAGFEHWHSGEHVAERLAIPGFVRGTRWAREAAGGGIDNFMVYELSSLAVLDSAAYTASVQSPTPGSRRAMAGFRGMVRSPCRIEGRHGVGIGRIAATWRFSARPGYAPSLRDRVLAEHLPRLAAAPGVCNAMLLQNVAPPTPARSAEQELRGPDGVADIALLLTGWDEAVVAHAEAMGAMLAEIGAAPGGELGIYRMQFSAIAQDYA